MYVHVYVHVCTMLPSTSTYPHMTGTCSMFSHHVCWTTSPPLYKMEGMLCCCMCRVCCVVVCVVYALHECCTPTPPPPVHHHHHQDRLPAKPSFYRYVMLLFTYNTLRLFATMLIASHLTLGYCVYGLVGLLYTAAYPPLLYLTFLHEFFRDSFELDSELLYYEEMHDAGYLFPGVGEQ